MIARDWRSEPDQLISDGTTRLLSWMARTQQMAALPVDRLAAKIEAGLRELTGAEAAALLVRQPPADALVYYGDDYDGPRGQDGSAQNGPVHDAGRLLNYLPNEPFFLEQADAELQAAILDVCAFFVETTRPRLPAAPTAIVPPSLVAALRGSVASGETPINGLALLWLDTPDGQVDEGLRPALAAATAQAGQWLTTSMRLERMGTSYRDLAAAFASAIDAREPERAGHSHAVAYYSRLIALELRLPEDEVQRIEFAGLLHNIGKTAIPDSILQKETALLPSELEIIRSAMVAGGECLREVEGLGDVAIIIRHQNERFDGGGYPDALAGTDIPLGSRILAVAQRFCAMTEPRAGRRAMSVVGGALDTLAHIAGTALDPQVVRAFLTAMDHGVGEV